MIRSVLPAFITLTGCAEFTPGFEADLTEVCAARSLGDDDVHLYAADADATVSMWVSLAGVLAGLEAGDSLDEDVTVGERFAVSVTTGSHLREPCSDLAMN